MFPAYGPLPTIGIPSSFPTSQRRQSRVDLISNEIRKEIPRRPEYLSKNRIVLQNREAENSKIKNGIVLVVFKIDSQQFKALRSTPCDHFIRSWDENGEVFLDNVDVGGVTVKPEFEGLKMPYLLALLNSRLLRGSFRRPRSVSTAITFLSNKQFLGQLPI